MKMGEIVKKLRLQNGLTQEELGKIIGVQKSAIRKYESGMVENIKRESIKKLADYFGVTPTYLLGYVDENYTDISHNQGIIGNNNHHCNVGSIDNMGEIEREILRICKALPIQKKHELLAHAYELERG